MINKKKSCFKFGLAKLTFLLFVLLCAQLTFANGQIDNEYSQGMRAYMDGDFERSQVYWLNAAKKNHAKSMFNIGLLHQQDKISDADIEKAETWFRLAGKHGYVAADFHLAKLKMAEGSLVETDSEYVLALLERAAGNGFAPAQELFVELTGTESKKSVLKGQLNGQARDNNLTSTESIYLTEEWIANKRPTNWTIQILAFKDQSKVHEFIDRHGLNDLASYFIETSESGVFYKLIYGSYQSKEDAEQARDNLSVELKEHGPWLRTIASVQALITTN